MPGPVRRPGACRAAAVVAGAALALSSTAAAGRPATVGVEPGFEEPCRRTCVIYGVAYAPRCTAGAGVYAIDVCTRAVDLIPGSPARYSLAAAAHPDSLYLGGGAGLHKWRIGSGDPPVPVGTLPERSVALTEGAGNRVYVGDKFGGLWSALPTASFLGAGAAPYIGDLAHLYSPLPQTLIGSVFWPPDSLVDVSTSGAQSNPCTSEKFGGLAVSGDGRLWGETDEDRLYLVDPATGSAWEWMALFPGCSGANVIQDLASSPRCEATPTATATVPSTQSPTPEPTAAARCVCAIVRKRVPPVIVADALARPWRFHGWRQPLDPGKPPGPGNPLRECLTLMNVSIDYHPLWNRPLWRAGCP